MKKTLKNQTPTRPLIYATPEYENLAARIIKKTGYGAGQVERKIFPDGERYLKIQDSVQMRDVIAVGGTISDVGTLCLYDLAYGLVANGCRQLTLVVPFFGYSTMERAVEPGEVVMAKARAALLSSLPRTPLGNKIALLDLHSEGLPYYFEGGITPTHLYAKPLVLEAARELGGKNFVLASVDAGRAKWVQSLALSLGVQAAFILKQRIDGSKTSVRAVIADVKDKDVVIYDDMIRTGGSVLKAAKAYKEAGASSISLIATHGIFTNDAIEKFKSSRLIKRIICTDSHPNARSLEGGRFLSVVSTDTIFATYLEGIHGIIESKTRA